MAVIGGGCSGLQYKMDLVDGPANRDIMVESAGVRVVVDPKSALFVSGSLVDFSDDLQKGTEKLQHVIDQSRSADSTNPSTKPKLEGTQPNLN